MKTIEETTPDKRNKANDTSAWRMNHDAVSAAAPEKERKADCTVEAWIVKAPWAHPVWPVHMVAVIHLRESDSGEKPVIRLEGATHEILVYACDPQMPTYVDARNALLYPVNFVGQFIAKDDDAARERLRATVDEIVQGVLTPDTDGYGQWVLRFGNNSTRNFVPDGLKEVFNQLLQSVGRRDPTPGCDCPYCQSARHVH